MWERGWRKSLHPSFPFVIAFDSHARVPPLLFPLFLSLSFLNARSSVLLYSYKHFKCVTVSNWQANSDSLTHRFLSLPLSDEVRREKQLLTTLAILSHTFACFSLSNSICLFFEGDANDKIKHRTLTHASSSSGLLWTMSTCLVSFQINGTSPGSWLNWYLCSRLLYSYCLIFLVDTRLPSPLPLQ